MGAKTSTVEPEPLPPTADAEDSKDLSIANHPPTQLPGPQLLHQLIQTASRRDEAPAPAIDFLEAVAVGVGTVRSLSYAELHQASDHLAACISSSLGDSSSSGAESETDRRSFTVPVLIPQSIELYVSLLAILKAGGAFCPLNLDVSV